MRDLEPERPGETLEREFRRAICADACERRLPSERRDVDDRPASAPAHAWKHSAAEAPDAEDVGLVLVAQIGVADLLHRSLDAEAGIVHEDVDRTARAQRGADGRRIADIQGERLDAVVAERIDRGAIARSRKHARPRGGERARRRAADAGRAPVTRQVVPVSSRTCRGRR